MIKLFVSPKIINGESISVDLLVYTTITDEVVFSRPVIQYIDNAETLSDDYINKYINHRNIEDINQVLKDRDLIIRDDIVTEIVNSVRLISNMYSNFNLDMITVRRNLKLKRI